MKKMGVMCNSDEHINRPSENPGETRRTNAGRCGRTERKREEGRRRRSEDSIEGRAKAWKPGRLSFRARLGCRIPQMLLLLFLIRSSLDFFLPRSDETCYRRHEANVAKENREETGSQMTKIVTLQMLPTTS
jgi:hypothetical protein